jgi:hypothetical protein
VYDDEGNIMEEKVKDTNEVGKIKMMAVVQNKMEDLIQRTNRSKEVMYFLLSSVRNIDDSLVTLYLARCNLYKKNMRIILVVKFQKKSKYILQIMFDQRK